MSEVQCLPNFPEGDRNQLYDLLSGGSGNIVLGHPTKRRSCELVNTPSPCVNKAIHHIEELEIKMKEWFLQLEDLGQIDNSKWFINLSSGDHIKDATPDTADLHVKGVGLIDKEFQDPCKTTALKKDTENVISEVLELIWRLEADRQEAEEALKLEKKRKQALIIKMDGLSLWKLHQLPEAVQKEHETCARDFSEIQWHIACKEQDLENAQNKAAKTEAANARLQEEISFIMKHSPLLEDKLNLEGNAMSWIMQAQAEASILLNEAEVERNAAQRSFEQVTADANNERGVMKTYLAERKTTLESCHEMLRCYKNMWTEYNEKLSHKEKQIANGKILYTALLDEKQRVVESEKLLYSQVTDLKYQLDEQEKKNKILTSECSNLSQEAEITKSDNESQISYLENILHNKLHALRDLQCKDKVLTLENEDFSSKIMGSSKARIRYEGEIHKIQRYLLKNEEQTIKMTKELTEVSIIHSAISTKLEDLEDKILKEEMDMKNLAANLKKEIMSEVRASQVTQAKITAIQREMQQKERESKKVKDALMKAVAEIENPVAELEVKILKLRNLHKEKSEKLKSVCKKKQEYENKFKAANQQLGHIESTLQQQLTDTQDQCSRASEQLKHTIESTDKFRIETRDLIQYGIIVGKAMKSIMEAIAMLQKDYDILEFKLKNINDLSDHLLNEAESYAQHVLVEEEDSEIELQNRQKHLNQSNRDTGWANTPPAEAES
ncbi:coiled-coil domain-containing protein 178 isoform X2 [Ascaphus truei]|uniref:coiled-coil domain-containing protein 178 isoform X2 n=1 Tax=Ascaphus truei TaxID=8439 RepID=UPI003F5A9C7B